MNGSEIVVFDVNRASPLELLLSQETLARIDNMLPAGPHDYRITVIGNVPGQPRVGESSRAPGEERPQLRELDLEYPRVGLIRVDVADRVLSELRATMD